MFLQDMTLKFGIYREGVQNRDDRVCAHTQITEDSVETRQRLPHEFCKAHGNVIGCGLENWLHLGLAWSHTHVIGMQRYQVLYLVTKREALHLIIIIRCESRAIKDCT